MKKLICFLFGHNEVAVKFYCIGSHHEVNHLHFRCSRCNQVVYQTVN